jgi:hypothetical protein
MATCVHHEPRRDCKSSSWLFGFLIDSFCSIDEALGDYPKPSAMLNYAERAVPALVLTRFSVFTFSVRGFEHPYKRSPRTDPEVNNGSEKLILKTIRGKH